jgi:holliday junction DNA helicase RuvA
MIAYLNGILDSKKEKSVYWMWAVLDIGLKFHPNLETLPDKGSELKLLIYHHITESDQRLFRVCISQREKPV